MKKFKRKGQALVETALVVPLLALLLVGVGYFGSLITIQHNLTIAARFSARMVSINSTKENIDREEGFYFDRLTSDDFKKYALQSLHGFDESRLEIHPLSVSDILKITGGNIKGVFEPILTAKGYAYVYKASGTTRANSNSVKGDPVKDLLNLKVGIGAAFFGARFTYKLKELDWMSKFLFRKEGITIEAVSLMPAELPLRGFNYGLMNINKDIFDIIRLDVHQMNADVRNHQYDDLVPDPNAVQP